MFLVKLTCSVRMSWGRVHEPNDFVCSYIRLIRAYPVNCSRMFAARVHVSFYMPSEFYELFEIGNHLANLKWGLMHLNVTLKKVAYLPQMFTIDLCLMSRCPTLAASRAQASYYGVYGNLFDKSVGDVLTLAICGCDWSDASNWKRHVVSSWKVCCPSRLEARQCAPKLHDHWWSKGYESLPFQCQIDKFWYFQNGTSKQTTTTKARMHFWYNKVYRTWSKDRNPRL